MAKEALFTNDVILKWLQYFAENTPIDLEQIKKLCHLLTGTGNILLHFVDKCIDSGRHGHIHGCAV